MLGLFGKLLGAVLLTLGVLALGGGVYQLVSNESMWMMSRGVLSLLAGAGIIRLAIYLKEDLEWW